MKQRILVRFANEPYHNTTVEMDITKLKDVIKFPKEVFGTIDGIRVAMCEEDYDTALKEQRKQALVEMIRLDEEAGLYDTPTNNI